MRIGLAMLVVLVALAGCTTSVDGTAAPVVSDRYLHADPCSFLPSDVLGRFGQAAAPSPSFGSCLAYVSTADGGGILASVQLVAQAPETGRQATTVDGVTVYADPADHDVCARDVVAAPGVVVAVLATHDPEPCAVSDALTQSIATHVHDGTIARVDYPPASLGSRDACAVLAAPRAPGAEAGQQRGFAGHRCDWGSGNGDEPHVSVVFQLRSSAEGDDPGSRTTSVDGHKAVEQFIPAHPNMSPGYPLPMCDVQVEFGPTSTARVDLVETASVVVAADADRDRLCGQADDLAAEMIRNLSG